MLIFFDNFIVVLYASVTYVLKHTLNFISLLFNLKSKPIPNINLPFIEFIKYTLNNRESIRFDIDYIKILVGVYFLFFTYEFFFEFFAPIYTGFLMIIQFLIDLKTEIKILKHYTYCLIQTTTEYYSDNKHAFIFYFFFIYIFVTLLMSFFSIFFGIKGVFVVFYLFIFSFWLILFYFLDDFFFKSVTIYTYYEFFSFTVGTIVFPFSLKLNFVSYCFLFLTTSIGVCAALYSLSYFKNEPEADRFIILINCFILSMCLLVLADNALLLFLAWELIGLTSFFLINFWTLRRNTLKAAFKAFTFNKLSDVFLLFFLIIMIQQTGTMSLTSWQIYFLIQNNYNFNSLLIASIFLLLASSIKSAQFFGHFWLPDSMEAPIPASALIHSATLVSSGVYLLLKFNWFLCIAKIAPVIIFLGAITAFYGAVVSAAQTDCKKLLAYSTISHCGFLFITIGLNNTYLTITYLYLHGFFKALTFFCVGNLVKVSRNYQDTKKMGQLFAVLPVESILLVISASSLGALPFTVGYFYKLVFQTVVINSYLFWVICPFILVAMLSSVIYVFKLIFYSLFDIQKNNNCYYDSLFNRSFEDDDLHSNTTELGVIFLFLLFSVSVYVYYFYILFYKNFDFYNFEYNVDLFEIVEITQQYALAYHQFFYIFFALIILVIVKISCRAEFSYLKKNYALYTFFIFLMFFQLTFYLFLFL